MGWGGGFPGYIGFFQYLQMARHDLVGMLHNKWQKTEFQIFKIHVQLNTYSSFLQNTSLCSPPRISYAQVVTAVDIDTGPQSRCRPLGLIILRSQDVLFFCASPASWSRCHYGDEKSPPGSTHHYLALAASQSWELLLALQCINLPHSIVYILVLSNIPSSTNPTRDIDTYLVKCTSRRLLNYPPCSDLFEQPVAYQPSLQGPTVLPHNISSTFPAGPTVLPHTLVFSNNLLSTKSHYRGLQCNHTVIYKTWSLRTTCRYHIFIQATLLNPDMSNPDFRLNRTDWNVPVPSYTYNSYAHNPDFA